MRKKYGVYPGVEIPAILDGPDVLDAGDVVEGVVGEGLATGSWGASAHGGTFCATG